ncbi:MAG: glycosyltransferase 87 family protein [Propionibacteriaceae bacterium]|nr:glycosyltransferase 87 family protein [Propionibacteriaceae bacterium]
MAEKTTTRRTTPVPWDLRVYQYVTTRLPRTLTRRLGGVKGTHAGRVSAGFAYLLAAVSFLICMIRQAPCRQSVPTDSPDRFGWMCYSDITALYFSRGQGTGAVPYVTMNWEYPVLTGYFAAIANTISQFFGAVLSPDAEGQQILDNGNIYFAINAVGLFLCLMWLISSLLRVTPGSPLVAMIVAISPAIWTTALINWDLLVVALTVAGLAAWVEGRHTWAGVWWGLAIAAKFYPLVIVGALAVLVVRRDAWRTRALRSWVTMALTAAATWLLVNLPLMVSNMTGWKYFYTFNYANRGADLGSLWYALNLAGLDLGHPSWWSRAVMLLGYAGLAVLIYLAPRKPSASQIAYLAVAVMMVGNLVYSPQYVLWLLPLVVLARPKALDVLVFTFCELFYFVFIWLYLRGDNLTLGFSSVPWLYVLSIIVRITGCVWVMGRVVVDALQVPPPLRGRAPAPVPSDTDETPWVPAPADPPRTRVDAQCAMATP